MCKKKIIGLFSIMLALVTISSSNITAIAERDQIMEGMIYINNYEVTSENAMLIVNSVPLFSLRAFFEGVGSRVEYKQETGEVLIHHLNDVLSCECISERNTIIVTRMINPANLFMNVVTLAPMGHGGYYRVVNDRIYLGREAFEWMLRGLGYRVNVDLENRKAYITSVTMQDFKNVTIGLTGTEVTTEWGWALPEELNGDRHLRLYALSDGSYFALQYAGDSAVNSVERICFVDPNGRIFELVQ